MNARTVDQWEFGSLFVERQREIGTPKHDRLHALVLKQTVAHGIEDRTLILSHKARRGHRNVCFVHIVQVRLVWRNDFRTGDASVKARLHHCASSDNSDPFEASSFDGPAHCSDHVNDGERGYGLEIVNTEMSGNRCHGDTFSPCRNKAVRESAIDGGLRGGFIPGQISQERWRVGMHNGQLQRGVLPGERRDQSPVVKVWCSRAATPYK